MLLKKCQMVESLLFIGAGAGAGYPGSNRGPSVSPRGSIVPNIPPLRCYGPKCESMILLRPLYSPKFAPLIHVMGNHALHWASIIHTFTQYYLFAL